MPVTAQRNLASEKLREIVATVLELEPSEVGESDPWVDELGMTSLEKLEAITRIQEAFGTTLTPQQAAAIGSVADALAVLAPADPEAGQVDLAGRLVRNRIDAGEGDRTAYIDPDVGRVSYTGLYAAARDYAAALRATGVRPGERGVVIAGDSVATVAAVLGHWWLGSVPVVVSPLLDDADIAFAVEDCGARVVHVDGSDAKRAALHGTLAHLMRLDGEDTRRRMPEGRAPADDVPPPHTGPADAEALVQYTSGSTGAPKGVRHSAAGLLAMVDGFGGVLGLRPDDTLLTTARLSFGYGFGNAVLRVLARHRAASQWHPADRRGRLRLRGDPRFRNRAALALHRPGRTRPQPGRGRAPHPGPGPPGRGPRPRRARTRRPRGAARLPLRLSHRLTLRAAVNQEE